MEKNHNIANPYTRICDMGRMTHLEPDSILASKATAGQQHSYRIARRF